MIEKYKEEIKIYDHYTDHSGKLFIKIFCDLCNDIAEGQTRMLGVDVDSLNEIGRTWMLHRLHIRINRMPERGDKVCLETWPSGIESLFALRDYRLLDEEGNVLVNAVSKWMLIDLEKRRPLRQTPHIVEMSTSHHIEKIKLDSILNEKEVKPDMTEGRQFTATFDNIDFNGHVTQASYMRWITNALPFDFLKNYRLAEVEVVYEHEIMPDSVVDALYSHHSLDGGVTVEHVLRNSQTGQRHCVAKSLWVSEK